MPFAAIWFHNRPLQAWNTPQHQQAKDFRAFGDLAVLVAFLQGNTWSRSAFGFESSRSEHRRTRCLVQHNKSASRAISSDVGTVVKDSADDCESAPVNLPCRTSPMFFEVRVTRFMKLSFPTISLTTILSFALLISGCQNSTESNSKATSPKVVGAADDPAAVAALEQAGCSLKKNSDGLVTEIAVSADVDFSETLKNLSGIPNVTVARFGGPGMNDKGMQSLSNLKLLKRLDLTDCSAIGDETLKVIGSLTNIEALILRRAGFTDAGLEFVKGMSKLRAIDLRNSNVTDAGVAHLANIKTLVDVQLEKSKVTDAGIEFLRGLPLKSLNLNYTAITDGAMPAIGSITTLESLQMEASRLTDAGMVEIAKLKNLKRFGCRLADVTGEGIKNLAGLTELTRLELRETSLDDDGLEVVSNLPKLTFLDISECRLVSGEGIAKLAKLTNLTFLELREIKKVKDESFSALATLTNLVDLNVEATRITDASIETLLKFQKLERLSVAGSQMGDEGISQLGKLPALKWLNLTASSPSEETLATLRSAKPELQIIE